MGSMNMVESVVMSPGSDEWWLAGDAYINLANITALVNKSELFFVHTVAAKNSIAYRDCRHQHYDITDMITDRQMIG